MQKEMEKRKTLDHENGFMWNGVFFFFNEQGQILCLVLSGFFNFRYFGFSVIFYYFTFTRVTIETIYESEFIY